MSVKSMLIIASVLMVLVGISLLAFVLNEQPNLGLDGVSVVYAAAPVPSAPLEQAAGDVTPGYYCQSSYSPEARSRCKDGGGVGMQARWFWCQLVSTNRVYDFTPIENWVIANQQVGLRSIVSVVTKDLRTDTSALAGTASCTAESDGTPSWMLTAAPFNNDINGVTAAALENPAGRPHLNYLDTQAKAEIRAFVQQLDAWMEGLSVRNPTVYASIEAVETMFGEQDTGAGMQSSFYPYADRQMYRCRYGGGTWTPSATGSLGTCSIPSPNVNWAAAANWRDNFSKPLLDEWGDVAPDKPRFMVVSNAFADAGIERSEACSGCGGKNLIDYAFDTYGIGAMSTGGQVDGFNGSGRDTAGQEYVNWWNVLKMRMKTRLTALETGATDGWNEGATGCCDTPKEIYWNALQGIDYGAKYTTLLPSHLYNNRNSAALQTAKAFRSDTVESDDWRFSKAVGIWFRDTDGTYYPDGDNGTYGLPNAPRGEYPCCYHNPNYEWLLYQDNWDKSQVIQIGDAGVTLPADDRSLWARRTNASYPVFKFSVDDEWYPATTPNCTQFEVQVVYLDAGTDTWAFVYPPVNGGPRGLAYQKTNTGTWKVQTIFLADWNMLNKLSDGQTTPNSFYVQDNGDGVDTFHMVYIKDAGNCIGAPSATATPIPALPVCTVTPVATRALEVVNTPTPTPTTTP